MAELIEVVHDGEFLDRMVLLEAVLFVVVVIKVDRILLWFIKFGSLGRLFHVMMINI